MSTVLGTDAHLEKLKGDILRVKQSRSALDYALGSFRLDLMKQAERRIAAAGRFDVAPSEVVGATVVVVVQNIHWFHGETIGHWRKWLHWRLEDCLAAQLRPQRAPQVPIPSDVPAPPPPTPSRAELLAALERAVRGLDEDDRRIVRWHVEDRLTYGEIAERLGNGIKEGVVKKRWSRALKRLRESLSAFADTR